MKALLICSGGFDSVTLAYRLAAEQSLGALLTFDYGQRHKKEIDAARLCAERLGIPHLVMDIGHIGRQLSGSALTDDIDVPHGHYSEENMKLTVVPNRNAIMLTIAFGVAAARDLDTVALAVHGGDHFIYPDCRPDFIRLFGEMQARALDGVAEVALYAPYVDADKTEIARDAARFAVPVAETWSCYEGGELHCGRCGTCVERIEAMTLAGVVDPTSYRDEQYWREAVARVNKCTP
ncbi:7-cyano-7-deazaguanine synthase QueC [Oceanisphaera arctica]|uniref:7-cyano-7-deazaguanine synthase n=1 Tax=Oceanisphaera arctica TaxID=641510 RepID=A0A2P5TQX9_9GAMM|nr:7-cyano-7-deazaguanine synthase QueC [Oceanisphaera arctica]PPL18187.1 7-cyano-7-deazaguanine synthase QueC [Oceanisphaera arctica]GHA12921.1 7-cyano-7-deazaguanine synthase [Oceanisphaera arctica]